MNIKKLSGDLTGGFIGAAIALPQALAFGTMTGAGAAAGLFGAVFLCFFAGFFGVKIPVISGPTGPVSIVLATVLITLGGNLAAFWAVLFLAGIFQILLSFTKIPSFVKYVPYPVISGFINGVGVILILLQIAPLLGTQGFATPALTFKNLGRIFANINTDAFVIGLFSLGILIYTPKAIKKIIPAEVLALVFGTVFATFFKMQVPTITGLEGGFPKIVTADFSNIVQLSTLALTVAVICSVETLMTGLVTSSLTKSKINNQNLIFSQGLGNTIASLFGGLAGAGATMRSAAAIKTGATTKFSALISAVFILAAAIYGGDIVNKVPLSSLAAILIYVGWGIIDTKFLKVLRYAPKDDLIVMFIVFFLTVFYDIIFAVGVGITLSAFLFAKTLADKAQLNVINIDGPKIEDIEKKVMDETHYKIRVVHILGEFFFGSATRIIAQFEELLGTKHIILCCDFTSKLDISAIFALEDIIVRLKSQEVKVYLVLKNDTVLKQIDELNLKHNLSDDEIFYSEFEAIQKAREELKKN